MTFYVVTNSANVTVNGHQYTVDLYDPETRAVMCPLALPEGSDPEVGIPEGTELMIRYRADEYASDTDPAVWQLGEPIEL
jgi:hypothetical protein